MAHDELCWMPASALAAAIRKIVGRHFDDLTMLPASAAFERAQPWAERRPPEAGLAAGRRQR